MLAIVLLGAIRQTLAAAGFTVFTMTAGGFIVLGFLMALFSALMDRYKEYRKSRMRALIGEVK